MNNETEDDREHIDRELREKGEQSLTSKGLSPKDAKEYMSRFSAGLDALRAIGPEDKMRMLHVITDSDIPLNQIVDLSLTALGFDVSACVAASAEEDDARSEILNSVITNAHTRIVMTMLSVFYLGWQARAEFDENESTLSAFAEFINTIEADRDLPQ